MSKILSFDQASKTSGYAFFDGKELVEYGKFTLEDENVDGRLVDFREKVQELINKYQPDEVIFEDIQEQNNIQTFKVLAEIYGVMSELLTSLKIRHSALLASSWKSTLNIKGRNRPEQKRNAAQYVFDTYGIKPTQDEADAICIGDCYIKRNSCAWS